MEKFGERKKAFLGAVLGAAGGIVGSIIPGAGTALGAAIGSAVGGLADAAINSNKQKKAAGRQDRAAAYQANLRSAQSMNEAFANTEYADAYRDRFTFALGGNVRPNKSENYKPAVKFQDRTPKFKIGGFVR